jgi:hypothetical protein
MSKQLKNTVASLNGFFKKISKHMSAKSSGSGLLYNKVVLYVAFIVSLINLLIWLVAGDIMNVVVFLLVGFLTTFFSKNMVVVLVFALVISNVVKFGLSIGQEGFEEGADEPDENKNGEGFEEEAFEEGADEPEEKVNGEGFEEGADEDEPKGEGFEEGADEDEPKGEGFEEGISKKKKKKKKHEGMQNLGYAYVSSIPSVLNEQQTLFANISKMSPYVINADNESKLRNQLKFESFRGK